MPSCFRDVQAGVWAVVTVADDAEPLSDGGSDKDAVGEVADILLGDILEPVAYPALVDGFDLALPTQPLAGFDESGERSRQSNKVTVTCNSASRCSGDFLLGS